MNWIRKLVWNVAAIDRETMDRSESSDKIWATQIGVSLFMTFVILFGMVYYSLSYINGTNISIDMQTNAIKLDQFALEVWEYILYGIIATVIALIIFLFDRAIYQADWFSQIPYGVDMGWKEKTKLTFSKFGRIVIRLGISIALAFALSTFVELKVYESELLTSMHKKHLEENKERYKDMKKYGSTLDAEITSLKQSELTLLKKLENIENGVSPWMNDEMVQGYTIKQRELQNYAEQKVNKLEERKLKELDRLVKIKTPLIKKLEKLSDEYDKAALVVAAEVDGVKYAKVGDFEIHASGEPTLGKRAKLHQKHMNQVVPKIQQKKAEIVKIDKKIEKVNREYETQIVKIQQNITTQEKGIANELTQYKQKLEANFQETAQTTKERVENDLKRVQKRLEDLVLNRDKYLKEYHREVIESPEFIQFRDGPMSRIIALKKLSDDPIYGEELTFMSWIVKGFMIFLEVIPVISKMFFAPPSAYAVKLQTQLKRAVRDTIENDGLTMEYFEESIALEKKKQELLDEKWTTRLRTVLFEDKGHYNEEMQQANETNMAA